MRAGPRGGADRGRAQIRVIRERNVELEDTNEELLSRCPPRAPRRRPAANEADSLWLLLLWLLRLRLRLRLTRGVMRVARRAG